MRCYDNIGDSLRAASDMLDERTVQVTVFAISVQNPGFGSVNRLTDSLFILSQLVLRE